MAVRFKKRVTHLQLDSTDGELIWNIRAEGRGESSGKRVIYTTAWQHDIPLRVLSLRGFYINNSPVLVGHEHETRINIFTVRKGQHLKILLNSIEGGNFDRASLDAVYIGEEEDYDA